MSEDVRLCEAGCSINGGRELELGLNGKRCAAGWPTMFVGAVVGLSWSRSVCIEIRSVVGFTAFPSRRTAFEVRRLVISTDLAPRFAHTECIQASERKLGSCVFQEMNWFD